MSAIASLWMPILATAVLVFIASSLIHMVFKWHNTDYKKLANEDDVRAVVRAGSPAPGQYVIPHCQDMKEMGGDDMKKKFVDGPIAFMTVRKNGLPEMGPCLTQWFFFCLLIAAIAGWVAACSVGFGANVRQAGCLVGMMSLLAYGGGSLQMGIWFGKPWGSVAKDILDSIIYALISGLVFMWLWPAA